MSTFSADRITKSYNGQTIIEDVSVRIDRGELVSLLGVSGVGKTTLLNILSGVEQPDSGSVLLEGRDVTGRTGQAGYMLQKDLLLPFKTVLDNISLPLILKGIRSKEAREKAGAHFDRFGLAGTEYRYPVQLSGGMRQRAALLRTYLIGSHVMLLDEPFSALDALTKASIHQWYLDIVKKLDTATLFITHDVDEAVLLSDRIYILSGSPGRVIREITNSEPRPRTQLFTTSEAFIQCKRAVMDAIGLTA